MNQDKSKHSYFASLFSQSMSYRAKFAALTIQDANFGRVSEMALLLIEYLQLASQILLLNLNVWNSASTTDSMTGFIISVFKIMNPGSLFIFQGGSSLILTLLIISLGIAIYKCLNLCYIICSVVRHDTYNGILVRLWKISVQLQGRVLYSIISSIWVSTVVMAFLDGYILPGFGEIGTEAVFTTILIIEFIFCLIIRLRFYTVLPTKSLLACKTPTLEAITLCQKFTLYMLQIIFASLSYTDSWLIRAFCLVFTVIRNAVFFKTLPFYSVQGLKHQGALLMIISSLDVACFLEAIANPSEFDDSLIYILTVWILLSLMMIRVCSGYLDKTVFNLAMGQYEKSLPSALIQKIDVLRQIYNKSIRGSSPTQYEYVRLIKSTANFNLSNLTESQLQSQDITRESLTREAYICHMFVSSLEASLVLFPKDELLKLYIAELSADKLKAYGVAMSLLANLQHSSDHIIAINATLLVERVQIQMKNRSMVEENKMNFSAYFKAQAQYMHAQNKIEKQTELQIALYQDMMKECPDIFKIFNQAQVIDEWRYKIEKESAIMMNSIPEYYTSPALMCAYYNLILNHSLTDYKKLLKIYMQREKKYIKSFEYENIVLENSYQENNAIVLVSGQKESLGKIFYCTDSLGRIYGGDTNLYVGVDISVIAPINLPGFGPLFSKTASSTSGKDMLGQGFRGFCYHKAGYMIEVEFYIDIFPVVAQGFYYCILIRPVLLKRNMMLLDKNGAIEGVSNKLRQRLNLNSVHCLPGAVNINMLSEELSKSNQACNESFLGKRQEPKQSSGSVYYIQGKEVKLVPFEPGLKISRTKTNLTINHKGYDYIWKITNVAQQPRVLNLLVLEEKKNENEKEKEKERQPSKMFTNMEESEGVELNEGLNEVLSDSKLEEILCSDIEENYTRQMITTKWESKKVDTNMNTNMNTKDGLLLLSPKKETTEAFFSERSVTSPTSPTIRPLLKSVEAGVRFQKYVKKESELVVSSLEDHQVKDLNNEITAGQQGTILKVATSSSQEKVSFAVKLALSTKYYWSPVRLSYIAFYLLLLGIGIGQIILQDEFVSTVTDLKNKKEILKSAQTRDFSFVNMGRASWLIVDQTSGFFNSSKASSLPITLQSAINLVNTSTFNLVTANENLQANAGNVDKVLRETLFEKDIRLSAQTVGGLVEAGTNVTNFQATDLIIQSELTGLLQFKKNLTLCVQILKANVFNSLNDLLLKTESTTQIFSESIQTDSQAKQTALEVTFIIFTVCLGTMLIILLRVTYMLYSKEKSNMMTVVQLDYDAILRLASRLDMFQKLMQTESFSQSKDILQILQTSISTDSKMKKFKNRINLQTSLHGGTIRKYLLYAARFVILSGVVIGLIAWSSFSASNAIQSLHTEQTRLIFSNDLAKTNVLCYLALRVLYSTGGNNTLRDLPVADELDLALDSLVGYRDQAVTLYQKSDGTYDPLIYNVLFGHNCSALQTLTAINYCGYLVSKQTKLSMMNLISDYEGMITGMKESYYASNKTQPILNYLLTQTFDLMLSYHRVLLDETSTITTRTDTIYNTKYTNSITQSKTILIILLIIMVLLSYLTWIFTFKRLKESDNEFKIVLRNFPHNLIVSNYLLKRYLRQTSGNVLDGIKSYL